MGDLICERVVAAGIARAITPNVVDYSLPFLSLVPLCFLLASVVNGSFSLDFLSSWFLNLNVVAHLDLAYASPGFTHLPSLSICASNLPYNATMSIPPRCKCADAILALLTIPSSVLRIDSCSLAPSHDIPTPISPRPRVLVDLT